MKIAVSAMGSDVDAVIDPRFGRAQYFLIIDPQTMEFESVPNPNIDAMGGAGIQTAQLLGDKGVEVVITGQVGPNAFQTLSVVGVRIYQAWGGTVRQALELYRAGQLPFVSQPDSGQAGMFLSGGRYSRRAGGGRGRRGGMGADFGARQAGQSPWALQTNPSVPHMPREREIQALKQQAMMLGNQLEKIKKRLQELEAKDQDTP